MIEPTLPSEYNPLLWATRHHVPPGYLIEAEDPSQIAEEDTVKTERPLSAQEKLKEMYLAKRVLFDLENIHPTKQTLRIRRVAAFCLMRLSGVGRREAQQHVEPEARTGTVGGAMRRLISEGILHRVGSERAELVAPHPAFVSVLLQKPEDWQGLLDEIPAVDPGASPTEALDSIRQWVEADTHT